MPLWEMPGKVGKFDEDWRVATLVLQLLDTPSVKSWMAVCSSVCPSVCHTLVSCQNKVSVMISSPTQEPEDTSLNGESDSNLPS